MGTARKKPPRRIWIEVIKIQKELNEKMRTIDRRKLNKDMQKKLRRRKKRLTLNQFYSKEVKKLRIKMR